MILKEILEKVEQAKVKEIPFVMYKIPDADFIEVIIQKNRRLDHVIDFKESGFVMAPFDQHEKTVLFAKGNVYRYQSQIPSKSNLNLDKPLHKIEPVYPAASKEKHIDLVERGIESIKNGDFIKAVLSRSEFVEIKEPDIIQIFLKLMAKYTEAFVYVWYHPKVGLWAGASPETLLRTKGNRFKTMSLAGTQKYQAEVEASWGEKEVQEQQIVTDHLLDSLEGISVEVNSTYTKKAGNLVHLCNDIQGVLDGKETLKHLIDRLHPTAAVCGFPKKKVQQFILKQEGYHRGFYTGFLGELNWEKEDYDINKDVSSKEIESNLFVNLRCMQLKSEPIPGAIVYVGGGITAKSNPVLEWEETVDKSLVMKSVLLG
ncbi:chorismate-binding protein [Lutimonas vermicola]|uniref:Chorismate-binding protein n=1 Tax=Lutimonas vermicola TaxID=414288 RepID=A0ABU9L066_9FLAO